MEVEILHQKIDWFPLDHEDAAVMSGWFPPFVEPVHVGVYNASAFGLRDLFRLWNGVQWSLPWTSKTPAGQREALKQVWSKKTDIYWRGLIEEPTEMAS
jgi:hypothetical protein